MSSSFLGRSKLLIAFVKSFPSNGTRGRRNGAKKMDNKTKLNRVAKIMILLAATAT